MTGPEEKGLVAQAGQDTAEDLSGVHEHLKPVAREHGLGLFRLTYASDVAQHALGLVMQAARTHRDQGLANAAQTAASMFNELGADLMRVQGWTSADTARCDASIRRAMDTKIIVPGRGGIILDS